MPPGDLGRSRHGPRNYAYVRTGCVVKEFPARIAASIHLVQGRLADRVQPLALYIRKVDPLVGARAVAGAEPGAAKLGETSLVASIERPTRQSLEFCELLLRERAHVTARQLLEPGDLPALQAAEDRLGLGAQRSRVSNIGTPMVTGRPDGETRRAPSRKDAPTELLPMLDPRPEA
jgi:hypothetical protein